MKVKRKRREHEILISNLVSSYIFLDANFRGRYKYEKGQLWLHWVGVPHIKAPEEKLGGRGAEDFAEEEWV